MRNLKTRFLTAVVFVAVMVLGVYQSAYSLFLLFFIITLMSVWEYVGLVKLFGLSDEISLKKDKRMMLVVSGVFYFLLAGSVLIPSLNSYWILVLPLVFLLLIKELFTKANNPFVHFALHITALIYIVLPCALVNHIANFNGSFEPNCIMGLLLLVWINDAGAYVIGSKIGKTPLFKRVSPKKTWEGSLGGVFATLLLSLIIAQLFPQFSVFQWMLIAVFAAVFGGLGDLVESLLKRSLGVKDSGDLLPGHGGMLDRFDAFFFSVPFVYTFLYLW